LFKLADLLEQWTNEIAALETLENGKPYAVAQLINDLAIKYLRSHAGCLIFL
jgi:acyl-CoA reductase-like NAD-dependent aldehyde dehydrogenase